MKQSIEEVQQVWTEWVTRYAPKIFADSDQAQRLLANWVYDNYDGVVSFAALDAGVVALADQVLKSQTNGWFLT